MGRGKFPVELLASGVRGAGDEAFESSPTFTQAF